MELSGRGKSGRDGQGAAATVVAAATATAAAAAAAMAAAAEARITHQHIRPSITLDGGVDHEVPRVRAVPTETREPAALGSGRQPSARSFWRLSRG